MLKDSAQPHDAIPCPRRQFLTRIGALAGAAVVLPALGGCETAEMHTAAPKQGAALQVALSDAKYQALGTVGASVEIEVDGQTGLLVRTSTDKFVALSSVCTHQGCIVSWNGASKSAKCPCHGAAFGPDGSVLNGPFDGTKIEKLPVWKVTFDAASGKGTVTT